MKSYAIILIFQFWTLFCYGQKEDLRIEIDKILRFDTEISLKKTPGFIIGILDNDSTYYFSFGHKTKNEADTIDQNDIFELGSITKVFTASIIASLESKNILSYQDKINDFLPFEYQNPRMGQTTIIDLINHTSSLPKRPSFFGKKEKNFQNPYELYSVKDLLVFYRDFIPEKKQFEYSHTNYAILELIIEKITGKKYNDVLNDEIFLPYKMTQSFVDFPEQKQDLIAPGYDRAQKKVAPWTYSSFKASEGLKTSMHDMLLFMKENLKQNDLQNISRNKLKAVEQLSGTGFNHLLGISNGWHTIDMKNFKIITHTGKTSGHNAFAAMINETNTAVVIFANSSTGTEDLGLQILRMLNYNWRRIPNI